MPQIRGTSIFGIVVLSLGVAATLLATLWPFTFQWSALTGATYVGRFGLESNGPFDFTRNILLFLPFGIGLAALLVRRSKSRLEVFLLTLVSGFLLSLTAESLQVFLPSRTPNVFDLAANTLGALLGFGCFEFWEQRQSVRTWVGRRLTMRSVMAFFGGYTLLMLLLVLALMRGTRPGDWDTSYALALGNELTADRPWHGTLRDLVLLDRAVDPVAADQLLFGEIPATLSDSVVADYSLVGANGLVDRTGTLSNLVWQAALTRPADSAGVVLGGEYWLATDTSVAPLARRINKTGQFTLAVTLATADIAQTGPARIVTVSVGPHLRNLTLGQENDRLVLRMRADYTGKNGTTPELQFPGILDSTTPRRMVVTYDGSTARVYMPGEGEYIYFALGPEVAFVSFLARAFYDLDYWPITVGAFTVWPITFLLYSVILFPIVTIMTFWIAQSRRKSFA